VNHLVFYRHSEIMLMLQAVPTQAPPGATDQVAQPDHGQLAAFLGRIGVNLHSNPFRRVGDNVQPAILLRRPLAPGAADEEDIGFVLVRINPWIDPATEPEGPTLHNAIHQVVANVQAVNDYLKANPNNPDDVIGSLVPGISFRPRSAGPHWLGLGFNG
jgi:hypothetical protein